MIDKVDVAEIARQRTWKSEKRNKKKRSSAFKSRLLSLSSSSVNKITEPSEKNKAVNGNSLHPIYGNIVGSPPATPAPGIISATASMISFNILMDQDSDSEDEGERGEQDIEEVWFPGAHGDIGGGWDLPADEEPLSHGPLVWMVCIQIVFKLHCLNNGPCRFGRLEKLASFLTSNE